MTAVTTTFRGKPVEAVRYTGENVDQVLALLNFGSYVCRHEQFLAVSYYTPGHEMMRSHVIFPGYWVVRTPWGEIFTLTEHDFRARYEPWLPPLTGHLGDDHPADSVTALVDFVRARITEDEAVANGGARGWETAERYDTQPIAWARHARRWTTDRVLVEVEVKRRLVTLAEGMLRAGPAQAAEAVRMLAWLALPHTWHPDYRPEWLTWANEATGEKEETL